MTRRLKEDQQTQQRGTQTSRQIVDKAKRQVDQQTNRYSSRLVEQQTKPKGTQNSRLVSKAKWHTDMQTSRQIVDKFKTSRLPEDQQTKPRRTQTSRLVNQQTSRLVDLQTSKRLVDEAKRHVDQTSGRRKKQMSKVVSGRPRQCATGCGATC